MSTAAIAEAYYRAIGEKNIDLVEKYIHPNIQFIAPLGTANGKEDFLKAARSFTTRFTTLKVRTALGTEDSAMVVYDLDCPPPVGHCPTAVLMSFKEGLIAKIELFFDARSFGKK
jgi:hypothetical protein